MNRFALCPVVGLFAVLVSGSFTNSRPVDAQQGPPAGLAVRIVNQPVAVTGNTTVSGNVTATQSGPWNVGITGTPTVLVHNLEEPGNVPYQQEVQASGSSCNADGFCSINLQFASVPSDKRLVLKQVSVLFTAKTGASVLPVVLAGGATKVLGNSGLFPFTEMPVPISRAAGPIVFGAFCTAAAPCDEWLVHQQVEYYIEPGSAPIVVVSADQSHLVPIFTEATLTGYYVPAS